jgi:hypothetical protein
MNFIWVGLTNLIASTSNAMHVSWQKSEQMRGELICVFRRQITGDHVRFVKKYNRNPIENRWKNNGKSTRNRSKMGSGGVREGLGGPSASKRAPNSAPGSPKVIFL